jgi:hypothetical protein
VVGYWELDHDAFVWENEILKIEVEEISFLTGLSHRGEEAHPHRWGDEVASSILSLSM